MKGELNVGAAGCDSFTVEKAFTKRWHVRLNQYDTYDSIIAFGLIAQKNLVKGLALGAIKG